MVRLLLGACALLVVAAAFPWTRIQATSLWGEVELPPAARTTTGFTCVTTALLTALIVLAEGTSQDARQAVRSASLMLMGLSLATLAWRLIDGPGLIRGVSASHTGWFFLALFAAVLGALAARFLLQALGPSGGRTRT